MDNTEMEKIEKETEEKIKTKNRFSELSEKVILTSKERDEAIATMKQEKERADALAKEASFYKDFSANVSKYPNASQYQEKILEKVKSGYSTEDAMVSVLAKEGKLTSQPVQQPTPQAEGGSALNSMEGPKSPREMSKDELRNAILEADKNGELARAIFK